MIDFFLSFHFIIFNQIYILPSPNVKLTLCVCLSDQRMMTRPLSAVGYRRPLCHHARVAMMMKPDMRYKVSSTFSSPVSLMNIFNVSMHKKPTDTVTVHLSASSHVSHVTPQVLNLNVQTIDTNLTL